MRTSKSGGPKGAAESGSITRESSRLSLRRMLDFIARLFTPALLVHDLVRDPKSGAETGFVLIGFGQHRFSPNRYLDQAEMEDFFAAYNEYTWTSSPPSARNPSRTPPT